MTSSSHDEQVELHFVGGDIRPDVVRVSDLAPVLLATESLIQATVLGERADLTRDDIALSLTEIQHGSLTLRFDSPISQIIVPQFEQMASLVQRAFFEQLPAEAIAALRRIATFTRKYHCEAQFRVGSSEAVLATVTPSLVIPADPRLYMQTTIYGRVVEAGGKDPNVHIETLQGVKLVCFGTQSQVKELAERLYDVVGIIGTARSTATELEISDFEIQEILPYRSTSIVEAMRELAEAAAPLFDDLDVNEFVNSQRE